MKTAVAIAAIALVAAPVLAQPAAQPAAAGGWTQAQVTAENTALLAKALGNKANYKNDIKPLCFKTISSVETQIVAGTNFKYQVVACQLDKVDAAGKCTANPSCGGLSYEITVFSQPWTHTLKVTDAKVQW
ncbi:TPA: hypothetical protein N0F65_008808 [Lagenidium giganteum]|uniref:Cystatin domain-containing protein n=1 Tax=Lagenidium giganteum TaxID=4803 RepID=A0AAV2YZW9_9STRA|nr:TPA: hypothetical protein N0F65_008808 [Lagenidium giganteum]